MLKNMLVVGLAVCVLASSGCAVVMASNQPSKKNLTVLNTGIPRNHVIAEFGAPVMSEYKDGQRVEIYTFQQGYSKLNKTSRVIWHGLADVASAGLWEVIGTPAESYFDGKKLSYQIVFDQQDHVASHQLLSVQTPSQTQTTTTAQ
ncbi:hypothetical protein [Acinetobacter ihumii]|uniref:hypothetical protein n=1 Tax=Acinetobacter ihumii TaxID=2483802 RepID=UPI001031226A|nr:hypothetical protein [Acinetobacter ihumii]